MAALHLPHRPLKPNDLRLYIRWSLILNSEWCRRSWCCNTDAALEVIGGHHMRTVKVKRFVHFVSTSHRIGNRVLSAIVCLFVLA